MGQLLNSIKGGGLQINFAIDRKPSLFSSKMNPVSLTLLNKSSQPIHKISIPELKGTSNKMVSFDEVAKLDPGQSTSVTLHIDFKGKPNAIKLGIKAGSDTYQVSLVPGCGEVVRPKKMDIAAFTKAQSKLGGMNESKASVEMPSLKGDDGAKGTQLATKLLEKINSFHVVPEGDDSTTQRFSAVMQDGTDCLVTAKIDGTKVALTFNCSDFMFRSSFAEAVRDALAGAQKKK